MATLPTLGRFPNVPEVRPLSSTGITRLPRYYGPVRHPTRPGLALAGCQLTARAATARVSRVAYDLRVQTCRRPYPGGTPGTFRSTSTDDSGLPHPLAGSAPTLAFSRPARRSRKLRPVCSRGRLAALCIEGFGSFVTSTTAPIATGWNDSCRVGIAPTEDRHLSRRTKGRSSFS
jgi:hypothetical protein